MGLQVGDHLHGYPIDRITLLGRSPGAILARAGTQGRRRQRSPSAPRASATEHRRIGNVRETGQC
eukprot:6710133-Lingulodinium_polyedra.AAC.1